MRKEYYTLDGMRYLVSFPKGFDAARTYPTLLFLHGAGTRGTDMSVLEDSAIFHELAKREELPFVVVAPLCSENTWFDLFEHLKALLHHVTALSFVDADRLSLVGVSMGGYAAWQLGMSHPECFAALVPICGGGMTWNASRLVPVPVWAFHGAKDTTVFPEESRRLVDKINARGGSARLTIYEENAHNAWTDTFASDALWAWLMEQNKTRAREACEEHLTGAKQYG